MAFNNDFHDRRVVFTNDAKKAIRELDDQVPRLNSVLVSINMFLGVSAHCGKNVGSSLYCYSSRKLNGTPAIECYYQFDESEVRVYDVCVADETE